MQPMQTGREGFDPPQSFIGPIFVHTHQSSCTDNTSLDNAEFIADAIAAKAFAVILSIEGAESILERIIFVRRVRLAWGDRRLVHGLQRGNVCYHVLQCFRRASRLPLWGRVAD